MFQDVCWLNILTEREMRASVHESVCVCVCVRVCVHVCVCVRVCVFLRERDCANISGIPCNDRKKVFSQRISNLVSNDHNPIKMSLFSLLHNVITTVKFFQWDHSECYQ